MDHAIIIIFQFSKSLFLATSRDSEFITIKCLLKCHRFPLFQIIWKELAGAGHILQYDSMTSMFFPSAYFGKLFLQRSKVQNILSTNITHFPGCLCPLPATFELLKYQDYVLLLFVSIISGSDTCLRNGWNRNKWVKDLFPYQNILLSAA